MDTLVNSMANQNLEDSGVVSFAGCGLKLNTEEDALEIIKEIEKCPNLTLLNLEGNTLGILGAKAIGSVLELKPSLSKAIFKDMFTGRLKSEIPDALKFLTNGITTSGAYLEKLDLSDNAFGPIGVRALIPFLQSDSCSLLKILRLNNNGLGIEGGKLLGEALTHLKYLKVFICGRNRLENEASMVIGNSLASINTLEQLEMPQNGMRVEGMEAIAEAIKSNPNLKILNLNDNTMCEKGGRTLAPALAKARNLEKINFGDCLLKSGCINVLEALNDNDIIANLKELILSGNEISGRESIDLILNIFSSNLRDITSLKLDLSCNCFGASCCDEIKEELADKVDLLLEDDEGVNDEEHYDEEQRDEDDDYYDYIDEKEEDDEEEEELPKPTQTSKFSFKLPAEEEQDLEAILKLTQDKNTSMHQLSETFVKVSTSEFNLVTQSLSPATLKKTDTIIQALTSKYASFDAINSLLEQMGIIKSETGLHKVSKNVSGPLLALTHSVGRLDKLQKDALQLLLGRPNANADKSAKIKHALMQALFS